MTHRGYVNRVEGLLRDLGAPFVVVDEANKAIFADSAAASFDLLIYMNPGPNMLAVVLPKSRTSPTAEQVEALREWERVFGKDFTGAVIRVADDITVYPLAKSFAAAVPLRDAIADGYQQ